jgi:hypothetical protein
MANLDPVPALVRAVPLVGLTALGLGPLAGLGSSSPNLVEFQRSQKGRWTAFDSAGVVGRRLVLLTHAFGGALTPEQLDFQTTGADRSVIESELTRMIDADLVSRDPDGTLGIDSDLSELLGGATHSMADSQATSNDQLLAICRRLHIAAPSHKQDRIDAIAAHFADPEMGPLALKGLSKAARALLDRIVTIAGPFVTDGDRLGLYHLEFLQLGDRRHNLKVVHHHGANPLADLVDYGFVGVNQWERKLWLWREVLLPELGGGPTPGPGGEPPGGDPGARHRGAARPGLAPLGPGPAAGAEEQRAPAGQDGDRHHGQGAWRAGRHG